MPLDTVFGNWTCHSTNEKSLENTLTVPLMFSGGFYFKVNIFNLIFRSLNPVAVSPVSSPDREWNVQVRNSFVYKTTVLQLMHGLKTKLCPCTGAVSSLEFDNTSPRNRCNFTWKQNIDLYLDRFIDWTLINENSNFQRYIMFIIQSMLISNLWLNFPRFNVQK